MNSSLPGKALRTLVDIARLAERSTSVLKAEPGKVDNKRRDPGILFISLPICFNLKLAIMAYFFIFELIQRHYSDVIRKVQRHHGLIKAHAVR